VAEYVSPQEAVFKQGYSPNTEHAALEIYRLLCIILASPAFAKLRDGTGETWDPILHLEQFEDDEITRILLSCAITARVVDDRENGDLSRLAGPVGLLAEPVDAPAGPLTLREACNKIIHAKKRRFDVEHTEEMQPYVNPTIYLYGLRSSGGEWKATLDVIAFAREYVNVICRP
jgi:hypothetical protein